MSNIIEPSTTLNDFTIERVIGKGSFGSVFLVKRKLDQKLYALKSVFLDKLNKKEQENSVNEELQYLIQMLFHIKNLFSMRKIIL